VLRVRTDAAGNVVERVDDRQRRTDAAVEALVEPCIRAVIEHGPCSQNTIEEVVRADGKRVRKALERAVLAKRLTRVPGARNALVYSYVGSTAVGVE
jgi:hypothetical protein